MADTTYTPHHHSCYDPFTLTQIPNIDPDFLASAFTWSQYTHIPLIDTSQIPPPPFRMPETYLEYLHISSHFLHLDTMPSTRDHDAQCLQQQEYTIDVHPTDPPSSFPYRQNRHPFHPDVVIERHADEMFCASLFSSASSDTGSCTSPNSIMDEYMSLLPSPPISPEGAGECEEHTTRVTSRKAAVITPRRSKRPARTSKKVQDIKQEEIDTVAPCHVTGKQPASDTESEAEEHSDDDYKDSRRRTSNNLSSPPATPRPINTTAKTTFTRFKRSKVKQEHHYDDDIIVAKVIVDDEAANEAIADLMKNIGKPRNFKIPQFKCAFKGCEKVFTRQYNLRSHMKLHTGELLFNCQYCSSKFVRGHDVRRHERLHTNERPFVCPRCGKGFSRSDALKRHIKVEES
ncbi:hypothetical protein SmJEL517_g00310 [Synchytrium microbalum]|uniref:C2H2-type domain-containing protein n=1 Tax=Synchytrium microbalum TaxID=1806994 RepID=A0A507CF13_9FUNG|nr:uncharacterized protein SmJEL517_g00310 [Synchytrium microbalum]TPX38081.1 hypothetical protein SmJEL517_g00310 [Synchytrium microbalum]